MVMIFVKQELYPSLKPNSMKPTSIFHKALLIAFLFIITVLKTANAQVVLPNPVCYGDPVNLFCTLQGCNNPDATFAWTNLSGSWTSSDRAPVILPGSPGYASDQIHLIVFFAPPAGSFSEGSVNVILLPQLFTTETITNVLCFGSQTGAIDVAVSGGLEPFAYQWDNGSTTGSLAGVAAGAYNLTITDANNCQITKSYQVTQPPAFSIIASTVEVTCSGGNDGSIHLVVTGGVPPYACAWNTGATTMNLDSLVAGNYSVIITDQNSCTTSGAFAINQPGVNCNLVLQDLNFGIDQSTCYDATQTITTAGNGTTFTISNGANVVMIAGQIITCLEGTRVNAGGYLHGYITPDGQYCSVLKNTEITSSGENETLNKTIPGKPAGNFFKIYPNPTPGMVTLDLANVEDSGPVRVEIFSMQSEEVLSQNMNQSGKYAISLFGKPGGIYLLRIVSKNQVASVKIVKQ